MTGTYLLLAVGVLASVGRNAVVRISGRGKLNTAADRDFFNGVASLVAAAIAFFAGGCRIHFAPHTVLCGVLMGLLILGESSFLLQALEKGPMGLTQLFGTGGALLIPMASGVLFQGESLSWLRWVGILVLMISFALTVDRKGKSNVQLSWAWLWPVIGIVFCGGAMGIVQQEFLKNTYFQMFSDGVLQRQVWWLTKDASDGVSAFAMIAMLCSAGLFFLKTAAERKNGGITMGKGAALRSVLIMAVIAGACNCFNHIVNVQIIDKIGSVLFFPLFNGGKMALSGVVGWLVFREKMSLLQVIGYVLGMVSVLIVAGTFDGLAGL